MNMNPVRFTVKTYKTCAKINRNTELRRSARYLNKKERGQSAVDRRLGEEYSVLLGLLHHPFEELSLF